MRKIITNNLRLKKKNKLSLLFNSQPRNSWPPLKLNPVLFSSYFRKVTINTWVVKLLRRKRKCLIAIVIRISNSKSKKISLFRSKKTSFRSKSIQILLKIYKNFTSVLIKKSCEKFFKILMEMFLLKVCSKLKIWSIMRLTQFKLISLEWDYSYLMI